MTANRLLWLAATVGASTLMLVMVMVPGRAPGGEPRFDEPGTAAHQDLARRRPVDATLDRPELYAAATRQVESLSRFSSRIDRTLSAAQPPARLWLAGNRVVSMIDRTFDADVLDAWTPLGPGNMVAALESYASIQPCPRPCLPPGCPVASGKATTTALLGGPPATA